MSLWVPLIIQVYKRIYFDVIFFFSYGIFLVGSKLFKELHCLDLAVLFVLVLVNNIHPAVGASHGDVPRSSRHSGSGSNYPAHPQGSQHPSAAPVVENGLPSDSSQPYPPHSHRSPATSQSQPSPSVRWVCFVKYWCFYFFWKYVIKCEHFTMNVNEL